MSPLRDASTTVPERPLAGRAVLALPETRSRSAPVIVVATSRPKQTRAISAAPPTDPRLAPARRGRQRLAVSDAVSRPRGARGRVRSGACASPRTPVGVEGEKLWFLLAGLGFCVVTAVLHVKRRWYASVTVELRSFYKDRAYRDAKIDEYESIYRILLGYLFPPFMAVWLLLVALS